MQEGRKKLIKMFEELEQAQLILNEVGKMLDRDVTDWLEERNKFEGKQARWAAEEERGRVQDKLITLYENVSDQKHEIKEKANMLELENFANGDGEMIGDRINI